MSYSWPLSPKVTLVAAITIVLLAGAVTIVEPGTPGAPAERGQTPTKLVEPKSGENVFWPYTSRSRSASGRTLAINVVVYGDTATVRGYLTRGQNPDWNLTEADEQDIDPGEGPVTEGNATNGTLVEWGAATGSTRYLYVHDRTLTEDRAGEVIRRPYRASSYTGPLGREAAGAWIEETDQLHDGTYLGARHHIRLYESPYESDNWVAIQAHSEHWDWFRLRHTVHDTEAAQNRVEHEFMGEPFADGVWRLYLDNGRGTRSDGWATVIDLEGEPEPVGPGPMTLGVAGLALGTAVRRHRRRHRRTDTAQPPPLSGTPLPRWLRSLDQLDQRLVGRLVRGLSYLLLFAVLLGLYLGIRFSGVALEQAFPAVDPKLIAASLYPVLAFGLPGEAYLAGRNLDPVRSFAAAATGIGTAFVLDYQYVAVTVLPLNVVLHRLGLVVALGTVAAGAVTRGASVKTVNRVIGAGLVLWVSLLVAALVGWL
ncbi:hypothetical protein SAMN05443574_10258 [Haloarcula vallismortis]|uniref:Uncharacterized protein n=2 Tax=Haloarcula vallismortis TaxID=28442 RepID=M0JNX2_HALVA|nr:hypothetical protein [Haloarcula vallismortis]EMA10847.1 hypothetical protein C437_02407 [Haloarcula vallismortis ATCC 29715]SDW22813.1 hypothetical protein SAMN05443574_10258 [Haloarcula vallismortis]